jgi:hypothetical protein
MALAPSKNLATGVANNLFPVRVKHRPQEGNEFNGFAGRDEGNDLPGNLGD